MFKRFGGKRIMEKKRINGDKMSMITIYCSKCKQEWKVSKSVLEIAYCPTCKVEGTIRRKKNNGKRFDKVSN